MDRVGKQNSANLAGYGGLGESFLAGLVKVLQPIATQGAVNKRFAGSMNNQRLFDSKLRNFGKKEQGSERRNGAPSLIEIVESPSPWRSRWGSNRTNRCSKRIQRLLTVSAISLAQIDSSWSSLLRRSSKGGPADGQRRQV